MGSNFDPKYNPARQEVSGRQLDFKEQVRHAKNLNWLEKHSTRDQVRAAHLRYREHDQGRRTTPGLKNPYGPSAREGLYEAVKNNDKDAVYRLVQTNQFNYLFDRAYNNPEGYTIGWYRGQKVMVVSGSRNAVDWGYNVYEGFRRGRAIKRTIGNLNRIAKKNGVDVVVGHSRGGRLVADMMDDKFAKLSIDGAMAITHGKKKRGTMNIVQKNPLDLAIGFGGKNNYYVPWKEWGKAHFFSREYKGYPGNQYSGPYESTFFGFRKRKGSYMESPRSKVKKIQAYNRQKYYNKYN